MQNHDIVLDKFVLTSHYILKDRYVHMTTYFDENFLEVHGAIGSGCSNMIPLPGFNCVIYTCATGYYYTGNLPCLKRLKMASNMNVDHNLPLG